MRQCELSKVVKEKGEASFQRTGEKLVAYFNSIDSEMLGALIELKKMKGLWVIDKIDDKEVEHYEIKRNWYVKEL